MCNNGRQQGGATSEKVPSQQSADSSEKEICNQIREIFSFTREISSFMCNKSGQQFGATSEKVPSQHHGPDRSSGTGVGNLDRP